MPDGRRTNGRTGTATGEEEVFASPRAGEPADTPIDGQRTSGRGEDAEQTAPVTTKTEGHCVQPNYGVQSGGLEEDNEPRGQRKGQDCPAAQHHHEQEACGTATVLLF